MPEGPEVKIVSDYINENLYKSHIESIECISIPYRKKYDDLVNEINKLLPQKFTPSFCRGKTTFIKLGSDTYFSYHLGMTGYWSSKENKHAHLKIITNTKTLYFHDARRFGNIKIINKKLLNTKYNINLDFLNNTDSTNSQTDFILSVIKTNKEACKVLLDQRYFLGVGNYLKSEILYNSMIHPNTKWNNLTAQEKRSICTNTKKNMHKSYSYGGAQIRDFKNPDVDSSLSLDIYNKSKTKDGKAILKQKTADNRISYWCPDIQKIRK